ncbi:MAG TPA: hypothetical protein VHW95_16685 [Steroidobacteraceae bacterium]|jgi:hypothetical protein|nr:hypothetical protein [Steroidobacteraceae bacterium]
MGGIGLQADDQLSALETEWCEAQDRTLQARRRHAVVTKRLKIYARLYERSGERLEISKILEARLLAKLEQHRRAGEPSEKRPSPGKHS